MVALYDAIPKFNPERATLSTYLTKPLHRAMSAYIHSLTNRSNSYYGKQMDDVRHAIHVLETEGKRTTESNIALYTNYSLRQVHDILFRLTYIDEVSYDGTDDEDSQSKQDHLEAKMTSYVKNPETEYIEGQATLLLNTALTKLNPTDLKILMTKFDSSETGEASYASTAKKLGLPVSKVKRSITRSLRILRNDDGLKDWFEYQNNDYNSVDGDLVVLHSNSIIDTRKCTISAYGMTLKIDRDQLDLLETRNIDGQTYLCIPVTNNFRVNDVEIKG